jgi:hypothetical protein
MAINDSGIKELLSPLFVDYGKEMMPADEEMLRDFEQRARARGVPDSAIEELLGFYKITNGVPCLDGFDFHRCGDEILFKWWEDKELWLGSRDDNVLRWKNNGFYLEETGGFITLMELLEFAFGEWYFGSA